MDPRYRILRPLIATRRYGNATSSIYRRDAHDHPRRHVSPDRDSPLPFQSCGALNLPIVRPLARREHDTGHVSLVCATPRLPEPGGSIPRTRDSVDLSGGRHSRINAGWSARYARYLRHTYMRSRKKALSFTVSRLFSLFAQNVSLRLNIEIDENSRLR